MDIHSGSTDAANNSSGSRRPLFAKVLFYAFIISLPFILFELLLRAYFAAYVGPDVWFYGIAQSKYQEKFDPKGTSRRKALEESTVVFHKYAIKDYSKYYPNQKRVDSDEFGKPIDVTINARGFRGRDFSVAKPPSVVRVVTLGASSTFGFKNYEDKTYPFLLEEMLNRSLPQLNQQRREASAQEIKSFEVINLGIPHLTSGKILALFLNEGLELNPDYVTFYEGINDAAWFDSPDTLQEKTKQSIKRVPLANEVFRELRYRLLSFALFGSLITEHIKPSTTNQDLQTMRAHKVERFLTNLQGINEACRQNGIRFIVANQQATGREGRGEERAAIHGMSYEQENSMVAVKMQTEGHVSTVEAFLMVHKELMDAERQWAGANNVPFADVIQAMDANRDYLVSWVHLNAQGNQVVAATLSDEILKDLTKR